MTINGLAYIVTFNFPYFIFECHVTRLGYSSMVSFGCDAIQVDQGKPFKLTFAFNMDNFSQKYDILTVYD